MPRISASERLQLRLQQLKDEDDALGVVDKPEKPKKKVKPGRPKQYVAGDPTKKPLTNVEKSLQPHLFKGCFIWAVERWWKDEIGLVRWELLSLHSETSAEAVKKHVSERCRIRKIDIYGADLDVKEQQQLELKTE